ncbi:MAG: GNAT family N-acetyltransferase [Hamadaea sp.]|nr:GNAT family N-acetyltransferase [Hamadaea sp.]
MPLDVRLLTEDDAEAAWNLGSLAFGYHAETMPESYRAAPGRTTWGIFDGGRLLAKAVDRDQKQWFGGRAVPTSGVAGVAVAPELRRGGLGRAVLTRLLAGARERGAAISTLFPSTPHPYRRLGWEEVGALTYLRLPTASLSAVVPPEGVTLRPATVEDVPEIYRIYADQARESTGMMDRHGPVFTTTAEELVKAFDGITVAVGPSGSVDGYATWNRGPGAGPDSKVTGYDLIGATGDATAALLTMFAGWASVAPTTVLRLAYPDPALLMVATSQSEIQSRQPWMLRIVDAAVAVASRGWPGHLSGAVSLELVDAVCPWNAGRFRLSLSDGSAVLEPGGDGAVRFTERGLAAWYAGTSPSVLRRAGLLDGSTDADAFLAAATAGPPAALHDYF